MNGDREYHVTVRVPASAMPLLGVPRGQMTLAGFEILWVEELVPSGRMDHALKSPDSVPPMLRKFAARGYERKHR